LSDFAHFAKADVLIAAPSSSFSGVAALLNSKCVVTFKDHGSALPHWAQHSEGSLERQIVESAECSVFAKWGLLLEPHPPRFVQLPVSPEAARLRAQT